MPRKWYRIYDPDSKAFGCYEIHPSEAFEWNQKGWGIFWSVNEINGQRLISNVTRVIAWYVELDKGTKAEQWNRIKSGPDPSLVVETKAGYHVYFDAQDATLGNWKAVVWDRLVPYYQADPNAKDLTRILRVPGYYHHKSLGSPYLVRIAYRSNAIYREADFISLFPSVGKPTAARPKRIESGVQGDDIWDRIYALDCEYALDRLSGTAYVRGETYSFKSTSRGRLNIIVDGKSTSCFLDENRRIGSSSNGGPTIWNWLKWYGHTDPEIYQIIAEVFPEVIKPTTFLRLAR